MTQGTFDKARVLDYKIRQIEGFLGEWDWVDNISTLTFSDSYDNTPHDERSFVYIDTEELSKEAHEQIMAIVKGELFSTERVEKLKIELKRLKHEFEEL